jgi:Flp pilus assembly pilin Flp
MERLRNLVRSVAARGSIVRAEGGQALIEYALIVSLIALVAIVALQTTGTNVSNILNTIAGEV